MPTASYVEDAISSPVASLKAWAPRTFSTGRGYPSKDNNTNTNLSHTNTITVKDFFAKPTPPDSRPGSFCGHLAWSKTSHGVGDREFGANWIRLAVVDPAQALTGRAKSF